MNQPAYHLFFDSIDQWVILTHSHFSRSLITTTTGARIAELIWSGQSEAEIASTLEQEYALPKQNDLLEDIQFVAAELGRTGLLPNSPPPVIPQKSANPESLTIYVTGQCNLRCKHCAIVEGIMPKDRLTADSILKIISEYTRQVPAGSVAFLGGEPFMHPEILTLLSHANACAPKVTVSTNGTFVTESVARQVAQLHNVAIQVSLDGADEAVHNALRGRNSYAATWKAIELFASVMPDRLTIATTLTKASLNQIQQLIAQCDERKIHSLRFINLNKLKSAEAHWDEIAPEPETLKQTLRYLIFQAPKRQNAFTTVAASIPGFVPNRNETQDHWCPLGSMMVINAQGEAYNCPILENPETAVRNVVDEPISDYTSIAQNPAARDWMKSRQNEVAECRSCSWRSYCGGGCTAFMALRSGDMRKNDEFCAFRRNLYREYVLQKHGFSVEEFPE